MSEAARHARAAFGRAEPCTWVRVTLSAIKSEPSLVEGFFLP